MTSDTIFAVSSGRPPAGIAVIRISGPRAMAAATVLAGRLPPPRRAALRGLRGNDGALLDRALVLVFPGPATATGDDVVEFHCHGGRAVIAVVEAALAGQDGLRRAEPGEFTRRALLNGRIDLTEAEGLADLLEAETEAQRVAALAAAEGRISAAVNGWADRINLLAASVEAMLDFADEGDVDNDRTALDAVRAGMSQLSAEIEAVLEAPAVERLKDGVRVVIAGPPNAGKSTLLNRLCDREAAIVSPVAGTTRDRIEASVQRHGTAYLLIDTAGLNPAATDAVEDEGIARAEQAAMAADVLVWMADSAPPREEAIWVHGRADMTGRETVPPGRVELSAYDDRSVQNLWRIIDQAAVPLLGKPGGLSLHEHQRAACETAARCLHSASGDPLVLAEDLRQARATLGRITGAASTEAMLDALFGRFCIGK